MSISFFLADECTWGDKGHCGPVTAVLPISSDSLITGSRDSTIRKWKKRKIEDGTYNWVQHKCLRGHKDWISDICTGDDPSVLFSCSTSGVLRVWKDDELQTSIVHEDFAECIAYCKKEELLVCGGLGYLAYYKPSQLDRGYDRVGTVVPTESIYSVAISEEGGPLVLAGGTDLKLYDIRESHKTPCWGHPGRSKEEDRPFPIRDLCLSANGSRALSAGFAGVYYWDLRSRKCVSRLAAKNSSYWAVDFANGCREFVAGGKVVGSPHKGEVVRADLMSFETILIQKLDSPVINLRVDHKRNPDIWITDEQGNAFCYPLEPPQDLSMIGNSRTNLPLSSSKLPTPKKTPVQTQSPEVNQQEQSPEEMYSPESSPGHQATVLNELNCVPPSIELTQKSAKSDDTMYSAQSPSDSKQPSNSESREESPILEMVVKSHFETSTETKISPGSIKSSPILNSRSLPYESPGLVPLHLFSSFPPLPEKPNSYLPKNRRAIRAEFSNDTTVVLVEYSNPKTFEAWSVLTQSIIPLKDTIDSWEQLKQRYFQIFYSLTWCRLSVHLGFVSIELKKSLYKKGFMGNFSLAQLVLKSIFRGWLKEYTAGIEKTEGFEERRRFPPPSTRRAECSFDLPIAELEEEDLSLSGVPNSASVSSLGSPAGGPEVEPSGPFFVYIHDPKMNLAMTINRDSSVINWRNMQEYNYGPLIPKWARTAIIRENITEKPSNLTRFRLEKLGVDPELRKWPKDLSHQMTSWMTVSELEQQIMDHNKKFKKSWKIFLKCRDVPLRPEWNLQTIEEFFVRSPSRLPQEIVDMSENKRLRRRKKVRNLVIQYGLKKEEYSMDEQTEEFITNW